MVQMKDKNDLSREWYNIVFISHMVQMKGLFFFEAFFVDEKLYIPHGSDESLVLYFYCL